MLVESDESISKKFNNLQNLKKFIFSIQILIIIITKKYKI